MDEKGFGQLLLDPFVDSFDLSQINKISKVKLILLPSGTLKLLAIHNAGCLALDSIWQLEHSLNECDILDEYTKRFVYAKLLWSNGDGKLMRMIFATTYLLTNEQKKECVDEISRLCDSVLQSFKNLLNSKVSLNERETAFLQYFANFFLGTRDLSKKPVIIDKFKRLRTKVNNEKMLAIYKRESLTLLYQNLTPVAVNMIDFIKTSDDIDFLFSKIFIKWFSSSLTELDKRNILWMEFCYSLLHCKTQHAKQNLNRLLHFVSLSMLEGGETDNMLQLKHHIDSVLLQSLPLLHTKADYLHTSTSVPNVKRLEQLLRSKELKKQLGYELIDLTKELCTYRIGYRRGKCIVDGERETFLKEISSSETPIISKAYAIASDFEVMRPFHLSPAIAFDPEVKDIQRACMFLVTLSMVGNMFFVPETDVVGNTVVITPSAKTDYTRRYDDVHITIKSRDSPILSADAVTHVIESLIAKEDCSI